MHATDRHLRCSTPGCFVEQRFQQNDESLRATQPEQFAGWDAGVQHILERMCTRQLGEDLHACSVGRRTLRSSAWAVSQVRRVGVVDVADVPADAPAIGGFQLGDARTCGGRLEAMPARIELRHLGGRGKAERVELRLQIAACAIGLDEGELACSTLGVASQPRGCLDARKEGLQRARIATADEGRVEIIGSHRSVHRDPCGRCRVRPARQAI
jgi:hypothetical protein